MHFQYAHSLNDRQLIASSKAALSSRSGEPTAAAGSVGALGVLSSPGQKVAVGFVDLSIFIPDAYICSRRRSAAGPTTG